MKTKTRQLHRNNLVTICNKGFWQKKLFLSYIKPEYTIPLLLKLCISTANNATHLRTAAKIFFLRAQENVKSQIKKTLQQFVVQS